MLNLFNYHTDPRQLVGYKTTPKGAAHYTVNFHKVHKDELQHHFDAEEYDEYAKKYQQLYDESGIKKHLLTYEGVKEYLNLYHQGKITDKQILNEIAKYPDTAMQYAKNIHARFEEGEDAIAKDASTAYDYAEMLDSRFEKGEPAIATNVNKSFTYLRKYVKKAAPIFEPIIATDPKYSYQYAYDITHTQFPAGEKAILTSPMYSYMYANYVLEHEWPEAEDIIATDGKYSMQYACNLVKKRFEKGEPAMKRDANKLPRSLKQVYQRIAGVEI